jgi:N-acetylglucosamine-6-sulfatase
MTAHKRRLIAIRMFLPVCSVALSASMAAQNPCAQIRAACQSAGYVQGGVKSGKGLQVDCVQPLLQGMTTNAKTGKPLPQVDPQLIAACRARNPNSAQSGGAAANQDSEHAAAPLPPPAHPAAAGSPNIVFVLTDDLSMNLVQFMPHVLAMQKAGVTFANYFVTDSLCCPSRSSIFTGRYPHDTGVFKNVGEEGGYLVFRARGNEQSTFATALYTAGYHTAFLGKYLNGYAPRQHPVSPGWNTWVVAGNGYPEFNYAFNQDGQVVRHGSKPEDYLTDVVGELGVRFIKQQKGTPFFIEIATFAPHAPYTPAPRDAGAFPGLRAPRTPAYNAPHDAAAPRWLQKHRALTQSDMDAIDNDFRKRAQSVLAVDKMIGDLQAAVESIGQANNTYFIFSSDNGYHMGEYRLLPGKMTAYDTDIHVPLIVTGPGVPAGRTMEEITENVDLCPTFTEVTGAETPANVDGFSLAPFLKGQTVKQWRTAALVEHHGPVREPSDPDMPSLRSGNPTTYAAIRSRTSLYVEYADGEKEYHDLTSDPDELRNTFSSLSAEQKSSLHKRLAATVNCHNAKECRAAQESASAAPQP